MAYTSGVTVEGMAESVSVDSASMCTSCAPCGSVIRMILPCRATSPCMLETSSRTLGHGGAMMITVSEPNFAPLFSPEWVDQRGCDRLMPENAHNSAHANGGLLCRGLKSCPEDDLLAVNAAQGTAIVSLLISHHSCLSWTLVYRRGLRVTE